MREREQKWDTHHEDDKLWDEGITNMIAKTMKVLAEGQEGRENVGQMTATTASGGHEASQRADTTREEEPEKRQ